MPTRAQETNRRQFSGAMSGVLANSWDSRVTDLRQAPPIPSNYSVCAHHSQFNIRPSFLQGGDDAGQARPIPFYPTPRIMPWLLCPPHRLVPYAYLRTDTFVPVFAGRAPLVGLSIGTPRAQRCGRSRIRSRSCAGERARLGNSTEGALKTNNSNISIGARVRMLQVHAVERGKELQGNSTILLD